MSTLHTMTSESVHIDWNARGINLEVQSVEQKGCLCFALILAEFRRTVYLRSSLVHEGAQIFTFTIMRINL